MLSKVSAVVLVSAVTAQNDYGIHKFEEFKKKFGKDYSDPDEQWYRRTVFHKNLAWIDAENAKGNQYSVGITQFADLTFEEFKSQYLTGYVEYDQKDHLGVFEAPSDFVAPDSVDWTTQGAVTPVKNQAKCGSCWSFSTTGALEGAWKLAGHDLTPLSEQNILDCDNGLFGGHKCKGGSMAQAFGWVKKNGLCSEADDAYKCADQTSSQCTGSTCAASSGTCTKVLKPGDVTGYTQVSQTEAALEAAVAKQPVSIAIEADQPVFQHYTGGVLTSDACGQQLDHGVLVVGYGTDNGQKYWKVKNSWGATWGDHGFIKLARGAASGGECGIRKGAVFPTVKAAEAEVVV